MTSLAGTIGKRLALLSEASLRKPTLTFRKGTEFEIAYACHKIMELLEPPEQFSYGGKLVTGNNCC